jgi:hypothetical protein
MNHGGTQQGGQGGTNRDADARDYGNTPSITNRDARETQPGDDSFGQAGLGGNEDLPTPGSATEGRGPAGASAGRTGKGPRTAMRADSLIAEELNERMTDDDQLDASEILVRVEDGNVLITGDVPERWMKHRAEDIADSIRGVKHIDNRLHVDNGSKSFGTGGAVRAGLSQQGSGFSSSPPNADWQPRDNRVD